eukprot:CAMPEP_0171636960 /NCGR_PEP_ID=MMETSP0990-20121206/27811_1 /TAXON_ID=483369 /ORGANISM="non described non described, Strain CCMP2098" /LENGTH=186 /DNA_ID=CAMNT_0012209371 /DNA_START=99 /DNA_END=659 /DNA_ORIENTATION=-
MRRQLIPSKVYSVKQLLEAKDISLRLLSVSQAKSIHSDFTENERDDALGVLVFSTGDPKLEIARNIKVYDTCFVDWLQEKSRNSDDSDERSAFISIIDMIISVRGEMFQDQSDHQRMIAADVPVDNSLAEDNNKVQVGTEDIFQAMRAVQGGGGSIEANSDSTDSAKVTDMNRRKTQLTKKNSRFS